MNQGSRRRTLHRFEQNREAARIYEPSASSGRKFERQDRLFGEDMNARPKQMLKTLTIILAAIFTVAVATGLPGARFSASAQEDSGKASATPTPEPTFDVDAAIAKLREEIKGKENEPAETVFKNIQSFKGVPAARILAIMRFGFSRSLGVDCTHCHTPDNFGAETKEEKQIARDMMKMAGTISNDLLKNMKSLGGRRAVVNCTTCHRGAVKPATNLPRKRGS